MSQLKIKMPHPFTDAMGKERRELCFLCPEEVYPDIWELLVADASEGAFYGLAQLAGTCAQDMSTEDWRAFSAVGAEAEAENNAAINCALASAVRRYLRSRLGSARRRLTRAASELDVLLLMSEFSELTSPEYRKVKRLKRKER